MKKILSLVLSFCIFFFFFAKNVHAQIINEYSITNFQSQIQVDKDATLLVKETISVNFSTPKHGIFRVIPVIYSAKGRVINSKLKVISITNDKGVPYHYERSRLRQSIKLKIGDPDTMVSGPQTYVITYKVSQVIGRFDNHDEVYWNVTGRDWDTDILSASLKLNSPFAKITGIDCFAGSFGGSDKFCKSSFDQFSANFDSTTALGAGRDFTIVVALEKENQIKFPSLFETAIATIFDNWSYVVSLIPLLTFSYLWIKRGRDQKYASDNIYYAPENKRVVDKPLFSREFLPTVYYPIQGYSPSQIGTVVDERVDIHDVVAEITELARLGFLKIEKIEKNRLFGKDTDYVFLKLDHRTNGLNDYQVYLLHKLFEEGVTAKTVKELKKIYAKNGAKLRDSLKLTTENKLVLLSSLKNTFYTYLEDYKKKLYDSLSYDGIFDGNPEKVRGKWIAIFSVIEIACLVVLINISDATGNYYPFISFGAFSLPSFLFAYSIPRRLAKGYSLYRQIQGLHFYLKKSKWREEISEKHLFFEEMLPLAISLGVIDKLAKDMKDLGVQPPKYFAGTTAASFMGDISNFEKSTTNTIFTFPSGKWSGASSWSGGSGFSGGSSGGGFGGGGGGSW